MKAVVNAVSAIVEDVRQYERRPKSTEVDLNVLRLLRERAEATLSNLVAATKNHATSSGMSPVSLLDAAASHVSSTITEMGKTVFIRKATQAEQEQFSPGPITSPNSATNGFSPGLRTVEELKSQHVRSGSFKWDGLRKPMTRTTDDERRAISDPPSSDGSSPPPIFDRPSTTGVLSDDSTVAEGPEDAWNELKVR
jgi:protein SPA2